MTVTYRNAIASDCRSASEPGAAGLRVRHSARSIPLGARLSVLHEFGCTDNGSDKGNGESNGLDELHLRKTCSPNQMRARFH